MSAAAFRIETLCALGDDPEGERSCIGFAPPEIFGSMSLSSSHDPLRGRDLEALLEIADVHKSSAIHVTGSSGLSALLWLCRRGYEHVGYFRADQRLPNETADAVLVAHTCDDATLARLLAGGLHVREGGALILQTLHAGPAEGRVQRLLENAGYDEVHCVQGARRDVHVAQRRAHAFSKAA